MKVLILKSNLNIVFDKYGMVNFEKIYPECISDVPIHVFFHEKIMCCGVLHVRDFSRA